MNYFNMDRCTNCKRKANLKPCCQCSVKVCSICSYCEMHDCPRVVEEINEDMNRFKEKIHTLNT